MTTAATCCGFAGESMKDVGILDGDLVVVRPQDAAEDGEIVVALVGEEATVKRFFQESDHVRLQPENEAMEPIRSRDVRVLGQGRRPDAEHEVSRAVSVLAPPAECAPPALFDATGGEPMLDELIVGVWEGLAAHRVAQCPVCGGDDGRRSTALHSRPVGGRCKTCGTTLN